MIGEMQFFDRWPGSPDPLPPRPFALLLLATMLTFVWLARADTAAPIDPSALSAAHPRPGGAGSRGTWPGRVACAAWMLLLLPWSLAPSRLELWALDVGHGTAVLLRAPGIGTWIFDAGSRDRPEVAREAVLPLLRRWETADLGVVLSHTDQDHSGALPYILERYPPRVWAGALPAQCAERLPHTTPVFDAGLGRVELPALADPENDLRLEIWRGSDEAGNEGSRSLFIHAQAGSILLSGDAEGEGLARMLGRDGSTERGPEALRLLLFPHHGSDTDQLGRLLARTRPAEVWISCSGRPAVQAEIERRGIRCRTTADCGPLALESGAAGARSEGGL
jgi:competence protein ComEC